MDKTEYRCDYHILGCLKKADVYYIGYERHTELGYMIYKICNYHNDRDKTSYVNFERIDVEKYSLYEILEK